ncbi:uncharacterized protein PRCAT00004123001 [Priceomyces carsonii]|uniref:uncharacterized protein n=1 Tax=Priceomyces carsonii TaxID=28549 RepID=UPI002ED8C8DC|nr:unnamed protein product [Priceomyces carsonii]
MSTYRRSRISSLGGILEPDTVASEEKVGIRKIAKACTRTIAQWTESNNVSDKPCDSRSSKYEDERRNRDTIENDFSRIALLERKYNEDLEKMKKLYLERFEPGQNYLQISLKRSKQKALNSSKSSLENIVTDSENKILHEIKLQNKPSLETLASRRIIVVKNIPPGAGINGFLAQVCGGPLERVVFHELRQFSTAELHFIFSEHARKFYSYGTDTGLLVLNGIHLRLEWADGTNTEDLDIIHPSIPRYLMNEIIDYGSRRCLIFSQVIPGKQIRHDKKLHYPNPETHFSRDLKVEDIRRTFSIYGELIDIASVISRKLCFSLHFADIRSAVIAKKECQTPGTEVNSKYGHWTVWFGNDHTDRPCLQV